MLATIVAAVLAAQSPQADAYLDPDARRLVAAARARRETIDRSITGYRATRAGLRLDIYTDAAL